MCLFSSRLVSFMITVIFLSCFVDARTVYAGKGLINDLLNSYLNEIREIYVRSGILQQAKRELRLIKQKIDLMVAEIEQTRRKSYTSEELIWNVEKRFENDLLLLARRRLKKNKKKIEDLGEKIDEIKYSNEIRFKRSRDRLLASYKAEFVGMYPKTTDNQNTILVKRKVPKNAQSSRFEYDIALKSLYMPLVRFQKSNSKHFAPRPHSQEYTKLIDDIVRLLQRRLKESTSLRNDNVPLYYSVEEHDPYAPGKHSFDSLLHQFHQDHETSTKKPFWLPEYSIFNFWTYSEDIMQDKCPENQIKVGHICVAAPPHRRK